MSESATTVAATTAEGAAARPPVGPQVIFGMAPDGTCTLSIGPGLQRLGLAQGQLVGLNLLEVYGADPHAVQSLSRVLAGESFTTESWHGGRILSVFYQPTFDASGALTGAMGVSTDVTDQRRMEQEIEIARERASMLSELSAALTRDVLDLDMILSVAVRAATEAVGDAGVLWLCTDGGRRLQPRAAWPGDSLPEGWAPAQDEQPLDSQLDTQRAQAVPRVVDLDRAGARTGSRGRLAADLVARWDLKDSLRLPLRSRGQLVGALDVARRRGSAPFSDDDVALAVEIAERCGLAMDNALLLEAQRGLSESLMKFKALADASSNLVAISDEDGRAAYINPQVYAAGVEPSHEDLWATVSERVGGEMRDAIRAELDASGIWSGDLDVDLPDRALVAHLEVVALHHPDTGAPMGQAWIAEDVTDLRRAEAALREAVGDLKKFKALVEASPDFIAIASLDGTVTYVNPPGRALVGMPDGTDVTSTTIADYLTPEGLVASTEVEQPAVIANGHWEGESTLRHWQTDEAIPVAIASFLIHDVETGEPFALATVQRDITERRAAETAMRELAEQRKLLLDRLVDAQDAERARIAADVHDDPVQALAAVDLRLGLLRRQVRAQAPDLLPALDPLQQSVTGATDRLRALLFDLEPPDLEHGLAGALRHAAEEIFEAGPIRWRVRVDAEPKAAEATRSVAYRIAREAMINARKHASAQHVEVTVVARDGGLELVVTDDGVGVGREPVRSSRGHRGLSTMQDRAAAAGGTCTVTPRDPVGTVVRLWLPAS